MGIVGFTIKISAWCDPGWCCREMQLCPVPAGYRLIKWSSNSNTAVAFTSFVPILIHSTLRQTVSWTPLWMNYLVCVCVCVQWHSPWGCLQRRFISKASLCLRTPSTHTTWGPVNCHLHKTWGVEGQLNSHHLHRHQYDEETFWSGAITLAIKCLEVKCGMNSCS